MRFSGTSALALVIGLGLAACQPEHRPGTAGRGADPAAVRLALTQPETIDYATVNRLVLSHHCVECHNPKDRKDGVDLSTYHTLLAGRGDRQFIVPYNALGSPLYTSLLAEGKRHMPPKDHPQISPDQISVVYLWLENGAKLNPQSVVARPPTLKEELKPYFLNPHTIDYGVVKKYVLGVACMKCHSTNGDAPDEDAINYSSDMTSYESLFNPFTPVVVKGRPQDSKLFQAPAITQSMPPVKKGYDPIDGLRIKLLRLWILNCAIEDINKQIDENLEPDPENPEKVRRCP